jgi:hypothetical protein
MNEKSKVTEDEDDPRNPDIPEGSPFYRWYQLHKGEFNKRRKEKYETFPCYRESVLQRQREYRRTHKPLVKPKPLVKKARNNGRMVLVFRISHVSEAIGVSVQTIVAWEAQGLIPGTTVEANQRYYTNYQISLLKEFAKNTMRNRYNRVNRDQMVKEYSEQLHINWR